MDADIFRNIMDYLDKAFTGIKPALGAITGLFFYVCFPDRAYLLALVAVMAASFLDIVTKSYSIIKKNGGYRKAIKNKELFSKSLWIGTERKIVSYTVVAILTGLSYRVIYLKEVGIMIGTFVYSVMFMREFQSNVENLIEAGADLHWLLLFSKKKNKELMKPYEEEKEEKKEEDLQEANADYERRI